LQLQFLSLHLGAVVFEPELYVLWLERGKALTVGRPVQLVGVLLDGVGGRVRVVGEPALQTRDLRQRVDENATAFAPVQACAQTYT